MAINISLQPFNQTYLKDIWKAGFTKEHPNWIDYNAPYFDDYIQYPNFIDFKSSLLQLPLKISINIRLLFIPLSL